MKTFTPCKGKDFCRDDGVQCFTCGRSVAEIMDTRRLIDELAKLALENDYANVDEFAAYIARKVEKKVRHHKAGRGVED
ncbi:MAG TPA: hypothetical protein PLL19_14380 [Thiobacillaceae bacterium]|nr:hypothetical protein [Thiobacillaceae bacterium]HNF90519.1 hypothetical protein [Thiobacillaceae bacterium]HNH90042.1 hypothetical protein [Thiobacillaceae bacterium]HNI07787.1 hypothetical protein [Thiobacillaceae bacterium]